MQLLAVDKQLLIIFKNRQLCNTHISSCHRKGRNATYGKLVLMLNHSERLLVIKKPDFDSIEMRLRINHTGITSLWSLHKTRTTEINASILINNILEAKNATNMKQGQDKYFILHPQNIISIISKRL